MSIAVLLAAQGGQAAPLSAPPSSSFGAGSVVLSPPRCKLDAFPLVAFADALRVELAGPGFHCCALAREGEGISTAASLQVNVELTPCVAEAARVQVSVYSPVDSRTVERQVLLADVVQPARPRALALAVAELIRSLGLRGESPQAAAPPVQGSVAPSPGRPEAARTTALLIHVEAETRGLPTRQTIMWGGRARFTGCRRMVHADLDAGVDYARARSELGDVHLLSASAGFGLGPRFAIRNVILDVGPRAELGWAWIRGDPAYAEVRTGSGSDLISSIGLRVSIEVPARVKIRPSLALEGGGVIRGVQAEANGRPVAGMTDYYLLAALGIAVSP